MGIYPLVFTLILLLILLYFQRIFYIVVCRNSECEEKIDNQTIT